MNNIKYINSIGEAINFDGTVYEITDTDIFGHKWGYESNGVKIASYDIYKGIEERSMTVIMPNTAEAVNNFYDITETDVIANKRGRLYYNDQFLLCNINGFTVEYDDNYLKYSVTVTTDTPIWYSESTTPFDCNAYAPAKDGDLDYPHDYPYDYIAVSAASSVCNTSLAPCGFRIRIYGACTQPTITIGSNTYKVNCTVATGEILTITSIGKEKTIMLADKDGNETNEFDNREKSYDNFALIPTGEQLVTWPHSFTFDVDLVYQRGAPIWN